MIQRVYETDSPVDDVPSALDILFERYGDHTRRRVIGADTDEPAIEIVTFGSGFEGIGQSWSKYHRITPEAVSRLVARGFAAPDPRLGRNMTPSVLSLTDEGRRTYWRIYRERKDPLE